METEKCDRCGAEVPPNLNGRCGTEVPMGEEDMRMVRRIGSLLDQIICIKIDNLNNLEAWNLGENRDVVIEALQSDLDEARQTFTWLVHTHGLGRRELYA